MEDLNFNSADEQQQTFDLLPPGIYRLRAQVKKGSEHDALRTAKNGLTRHLKLELTVVSDGTQNGRKLWDYVTVSYDGSANGEQAERYRTAVRLGRAKLRAMLESAFNLDPHDSSQEAQAKRHPKDFMDFDLLSFWAKVEIREGSNGYKDSNTVAYVITNRMTEWPQQQEARELVPFERDMDDEIPF